MLGATVGAGVLAAVGAVSAGSSGSAVPSSVGHRAGASPLVVAPLVRFAFALERDALSHQESAPAQAKRELESAAAVLGQALALGPAGSVATDLRVALKFDRFAAGLVLTVNQDKVRLDITSALIRKEAALKALGQPLAGPFVSPQATKPPLPRPKKAARKLVSRSKIAKLVESAARSEYEAAHSDFVFGQEKQGYDRLYYAGDRLIEAIGAAYADPKLSEVVKLLNRALVKDLSVITGSYVRQSLSVSQTLGYAILLKAAALDALGFPPLSMKPMVATFDPSQRATDYNLDVTERLRFLPATVEQYSVEWTLTLRQIDPDGSSPPTYQSTDKGAENYASAAYDSACNNSFLGGGRKGSEIKDITSVYTWTGEGIQNQTGRYERFIWYHGEPGTYPNSTYGCDHHKMGARGHQGTVRVVVRSLVWTCRAEIAGTSLTPTPVESGPPECHAVIFFQP